MRRRPTLAEVRRQAERHAIEEILLRHHHQHADVAAAFRARRCAA